MISAWHLVRHLKIQRSFKSLVKNDLHSGDSLRFKYTGAQHNVVEVDTEEKFEKCEVR